MHLVMPGFVIPGCDPRHDRRPAAARARRITWAVGAHMPAPCDDAWQQDQRRRDQMVDIYGFTAKTIDGATQPLADYRDKVLLVVNVASKCGLTPQYDALQKIHAVYADKGFAVLGFPCNQFAGQEPGSDADAKAFCSTSYGVTFPMFSKIDVNGTGKAPLYSW